MPCDPTASPANSRREATGSAVGCSGNLTLKLTEFPDPDGKCVYFRLPDLSAAVPDELLGDVASGR